MATEYTEHMIEKHVASVTLAKLRYGVIHKVSGVNPNVELISVKREKDEITVQVKNDIHTLNVDDFANNVIDQANKIIITAETASKKLKVLTFFLPIFYVILP